MSHELTVGWAPQSVTVLRVVLGGCFWVRGGGDGVPVVELNSDTQFCSVESRMSWLYVLDIPRFSSKNVFCFLLKIL